MQFIATDFAARRSFNWRQTETTARDLLRNMSGQICGPVKFGARLCRAL
jgi:hypothetical protein